MYTTEHVICRYNLLSYIYGIQVQVFCTGVRNSCINYPRKPNHFNLSSNLI